MGPDFGCVCFHCGPVPFSGTPVCKIGDNVWANYQVNFCASTTPRITNLLTTRACVCDTGRATASPRRRMGSSSRTTSAWLSLLPRSAARPGGGVDGALDPHRRVARISIGAVPGTARSCQGEA